MKLALVFFVGLSFSEPSYAHWSCFSALRDFYSKVFDSKKLENEHFNALRKYLEFNNEEVEEGVLRDLISNLENSLSQSEKTEKDLLILAGEKLEEIVNKRKELEDFAKQEELARQKKREQEQERAKEEKRQKLLALEKKLINELSQYYQKNKPNLGEKEFFKNDDTTLSQLIDDIISVDQGVVLKGDKLIFEKITEGTDFRGTLSESKSTFPEAFSKGLLSKEIYEYLIPELDVTRNSTLVFSCNKKQFIMLRSLLGDKSEEIKRTYFRGFEKENDVFHLRYHPLREVAVLISEKGEAHLNLAKLIRKTIKSQYGDILGGTRISEGELYKSTDHPFKNQSGMILGFFDYFYMNMYLKSRSNVLTWMNYKRTR